MAVVSTYGPYPGPYSQDGHSPPLLFRDYGERTLAMLNTNAAEAAKGERELMRHMPPTTGTSGSYLPYMIMHGIGSLILLALFVTLAIVLINKYQKGQLSAPGFMKAHHAANIENDPYLSALKLLNERLAKGEVDVDEYYARRTALKGPDPTNEA